MVPQYTIASQFLRYFSSDREFDLSEVRNLGLSKILNTILVILFAIFDVLVCDSCCCCFFRTHRPTLHHYLAIYTERAEPTFRPSRDAPLRTTQASRSPKDPRASLGGPERWLGPLCVYCKVVVESRSMRAKKFTKKYKKRL